MGPRRRSRRRMHAPSEAWRKAFLARCALRFKESRAQTISACRHKRLSESKQLRDAVFGEVELDRRGGVKMLTMEEEEELILELQAMLDEERKKEEEQVLERAEKEDDEEIEELVRWQERLKIGEEGVGVLCPLCEKNRLRMNKSTVFCRCGVRLSAGTKDQLTEDIVRQRLADLLEEHRKKCREKPVFEMRNDYGFEFLHMRCRACNDDLIAF